VNKVPRSHSDSVQVAGSTIVNRRNGDGAMRCATPSASAGYNARNAQNAAVASPAITAGINP
jgi:hypothetical protein